VVLIQPTAVGTPSPQHARNYMHAEPKPPSPMISAGRVADAILQAAVDPSRAVRIGTMSKVGTTLAKIAPAIGDRFAAAQAGRQQYEEPPRRPAGDLRVPSEATGVVSRVEGPGASRRETGRGGGRRA
jgi:hypothetical protein